MRFVQTTWKEMALGSINGADLGTFGVYTFDFEDQPTALIRDSLQELEELGWGSLWIPELLGREAFSHAGYLLSCTERMTVINGIAQIWSRGAFWTRGASTLLADAYPGRYVLGLGYGGYERPGPTPMVAMTAYLDELDAAESPNPAPKFQAPRILAAYGPKMLTLARDRTEGAHCYKVSVAHTAQAREILGPDSFLGVEHAVLFETDPAAARAVARAHLAIYLAGQYNIAKFRRLGYSDKDLSNGGSDRFVDDFVFWGHPDTIAEKLQTHADAGADHVSIQVIGIKPGKTAMPHWRMLAEALPLR
jgi:probable F420-dependent oxidoreductase